MNWLENYIYNGAMALVLAFILFYYIARDKFSFDYNGYLLSAFLLILVITGLILPVGRFFRTRRNIRHHNRRIEEKQQKPS